MSRRVFFITGTEATVFEWHDQTLFASFQFNNSKEDVELFKQYLSNTKPQLSYVLVDLLDEEFQHEKIPHVHGKDKEALIKRQLSRHCRDAKFTYAKIIGRESTNRRDDKLLMASISSSENLDSWLQLLNEYSVPIVGIWSLPMLSEDILKNLNLKTNTLLLVSRQIDNTLRESFFKYGKLYLSRHIKTDSPSTKEAGEKSYVSQGIEQIHKFLTNQRIIPFAQKLDLIFLIQKASIEKLKTTVPSTDSLIFQFKDLESLFKKYKIKCTQPYQSNILFSYICCQKMPYTDHYSTNKIKRPYYRYLFDRFIFFTGTIGTITLMSISAFFYISSLETLNGKRSLDNSTDRLSQIYQNTFHEVADKISDSELIKESVEFHKKIAREAEISPELFLQPLSTVFSQKRFDIIALQSLSWNKTHGLELEQLRQEIWRKTTPNISTTDEYPFNENEIDDKSPVVTLTGKINRQNLNYRETVSIMESFVKSLNSIKEVEQLLVVRTPVDIRITSRFSDQSGLNSTIKTANSDADTYEILLLLQPSQPKLVEEIIVYDQ